MFNYKVLEWSKKLLENQMKIVKTLIAEKIFQLMFQSKLELASTFLRFQEYYESPEFKGRIFTLDEYKQWYVRQKGSFTYYTDWSGFNIPSSVLTPFLEGKFDPLCEKEKELLGIFEKENHPFYIIGVYKGLQKKNHESLVRHEKAHGYFYTNDEYRKRVLEILNRYDLSNIFKALSRMDGYHRDVWLDEAHAYALTGSRKQLESFDPQMVEELEVLYRIYDR